MWLRYVMISNLLLYFISETLLYETNKKNIYVQLVSSWLMTYLQVVLVVLDVNQMSTEFISAEGNRFRSHLWLIWWYPSMLVAFVTHNLVATYPEDLSAPSVRPTQTKRYEKWFSSVLQLQKTKKNKHNFVTYINFVELILCVNAECCALTTQFGGNTVHVKQRLIQHIETCWQNVAWIWRTNTISGI